MSGQTSLSPGWAFLEGDPAELFDAEFGPVTSVTRGITFPLFAGEFCCKEEETLLFPCVKQKKKWRLMNSC